MTERFRAIFDALNRGQLIGNRRTLSKMPCAGQEAALGSLYDHYSLQYHKQSGISRDASKVIKPDRWFSRDPGQHLDVACAVYLVN